MLIFSHLPPVKNITPVEEQSCLRQSGLAKPRYFNQVSWSVA